MSKKLKGYVSSRKIAESIIPQKIQNMLLRSFCIENGYLLSLSSTEYSPDNSFLMLEKTINEIDMYDGVIAYSIYQLPKNIKSFTYLKRTIFTQISKNRAPFGAFDSPKASQIFHSQQTIKTDAPHA